jgi:hypothetical protein
VTKVYKLSHDMLIELLAYDPATGVFTWKVSRSNRVKPGSRAGVLHHASGGRYISIDNEKFMAHRLAFFYVNKRWPNTDVRPDDGNYDNCAIDNLKEVSRVELAHQRNTISTNTSGYPGVSRSKRDKWQSKITWNYKQINLGASFETAEDAAEMYREAEQRLKAATPETLATTLDELRLWRRQLTAWRNLQRSDVITGWTSFEEFCRDVTEAPEARYAMAPIDATRPIGPSNFKWSLPIGSEMRVSDGRVAYNRVNREANRDFHRDRDFRKKYGIDFAEYQRLLVDQKGVCAICEKPETKLQNSVIRMLSVDHNHSTGAVRGLLCANCNMALGYACDNPEILIKAIAYLRKHSGEKPFAPAVINGTLGAGG